MAKITKRNKRLIIQFVEYMISGGAYFWSGYLAFAFLYGNQQNSWPSLHWNLWWSTIVSNVFGWSINYILQRYWVFSNKNLKGHATQVTGRYLFITLVDFVLNYFILYGLKQVGITPYIGQFISSGFFTVWNWLWYKYWVFPEKFTKRKSKVTVPRVVAHRAHGHSAYHSH
jgi:putative flippase GtrA